MTTKEQERKALNKIRTIVDELGEDSYIGTAFTGAFELAEKNIEYDAANSAQWYMDKYFELKKQLDEARLSASFQKNNYEARLKTLQAELDAELDWQPHEIDLNVSQSDYDELREVGCTRELTDDEAKDIVENWFGFNRDKIEIVRSVPTYEISKHGRLRSTGETERKPLYNATDWHYIRFDCRGRCYELYNDELRPFCD